MAAHVYWRINVTANNGSSFLAIAETEMRATAGGADQCAGGTASASSEFSGSFVAGNAVDNNASTVWSPTSTTGWWRYQFASAVEVLEYTIQGHPSSPTRDPRDWTLEFSDDGTNWTVTDTRTGQTGWTNGQIRTFTVTPVDPAEPDARVTQAAFLTLDKGTTDARVTQVAVMALSLEGVEARATQAAWMTLSKEEVGARVTQTAWLALVHETPCLQKLAQCWSIARTDGVTLRYTTHDGPVTLQGEVYAPCDSLRVSAQSGGVLSGGTVGDAGVRGLIVDGAITQRDILGGLYDGAVVEVWEQQWDPTNEHGFIPRRLARGIFGKITHGDVAYNAELVSPGARLMQRPLLRPHTPACRHDLGEGLCPVDLGPLTVSGSVTATPARSALHRSEFRMFADSTRAEAEGYFADGRVTWTSGLNAGFSAEIRTNTAGVFTLWAPMPYKIAAGDAYTMTPGCNKTRGDHTVKFGLDMVDFGGFPDLPGNDAILQTPNAKA